MCIVSKYTRTKLYIKRAIVAKFDDENVVFARRKRTITIST